MRWTLLETPDTTKVLSLQKALGIPEVLSKILVQRGIDTFDKAKLFFRPKLDDLHDPFLMKDMYTAVNRVLLAIENQENIMIYGDYDVDGTTSVALVYSYLVQRYPNITTYIPDRYKEGYGVSYQGIDYAEDNDISLIIALDCGIKAVDKVAYATKKGIDFIICDHHLPGDTIPEAVAILNAKQEDCNYPYKELCGCGVGFKLLQAIHIQNQEAMDLLYPFLDLVSIAVAADIVPITGENRIFAYHGLKILQESPRIGIQALLHHAKKEIKTITDVVFVLAPRINAAGRIRHGIHAVELLIEQDLEAALAFAEEINKNNTDRKALDKEITQEALAQIIENNEEEKYSTVVFKETWHKGVIGIVASRLTETYYRPTIVFTESSGKYVASARSVTGYSVYEALVACSEYIEQFGGHKYAAGLTIKPENYEAFKAAFEAYVKQTMPEALRTPEIVIDSCVAVEDISSRLYRILAQMGPFGPKNMRPKFLLKDVKDTGYAKQVGVDKTHLKLALTNSSGVVISGIGFNLGDKISLLKEPIDTVASIEENHWNNTVKLQLNLRDIKKGT